MAKGQVARGPRQAGAEGAPLAEAGPPIRLARRVPWRRRWPGARPGRPSWWEVPPAGYLEVESRHSPTRPSALRALAKAAIGAGLSWSPDKPLPVQRFVAAQERARLAFHARRELPRVTAVASQVMVVDSRLAEAEELLDRARQERLSAADLVRRRAAAGSATPATAAGGQGVLVSLVGRLRRLRQDRRARHQYRVALAQEAAAQAMLRQLREELAVLVPQLFAAEQAALLFWRYQVAIGDAAQHAFEQHLAAFSRRRSRGMWRPIKDWWWGATPPVPEVTGSGLTSVGAGQPDWADQVAQVTMAAKRVLVRRGLLDITHGLRRPPLPGAWTAQRDGVPASRSPAAADGESGGRKGAMP